MPMPSAHPHRKQSATVIIGGESGRWMDLGLDCAMPPESGKFVGYMTAEGADQGKLGLVNGDNTSGKIVGFVHVSVNPNFAQEGIHQRALSPDYLYKAGQSLFVTSDLEAVFNIKMGTSTNGKTIADLLPGMHFGLKIEDGLQVLDPDSTGGPITIVDEITIASRGYVRVKINSAAV